MENGSVVAFALMPPFELRPSTIDLPDMMPSDPALSFYTGMEYRDYGFKGVISKPFTLEELNTTLHSVMGMSTPSCRVH